MLLSGMICYQIDKACHALTSENEADVASKIHYIFIEADHTLELFHLDDSDYVRTPIPLLP